MSDINYMKNEVYIIAELGNTHDGSLGLAKQMIKAASICGVSAVKLQTHIFEAESLPNAPNPPYFNDESRESYFKRTAFDFKEYNLLKDYAKKECCIDFLSSPFSEEAVYFLEKVGVDLYKVPSGEISNIPLLRAIAKTKKPVILSSGMSTMNDINLAYNELIENGSEDIAILQCSSRYPCPYEKVGLNIMQKLKEKYNIKVGFSDHTIGCAAPLAAVTLGAQIIEKHFTLSCLMYGSDAANSMEPNDFQKLVKNIREVETIISSPIDKDNLDKDLIEMKLIFEKSIVTKYPIKADEIIKEEMITAKKPGTGIPTKYLDSIVGSKVKRDLDANYLLKKEDIYDFNT